MDKSKITLENISTVIDQLTGRQREVVFLHLCAGFSFQEIADLLGLTLRTTKKLMERSIDLIFSKLNEKI
ncbi:MAG: Sigma-70, region 4 [Sphingobacterium sp.]|jgi:RNA polymerase sigma factor (sigma-70 family)|nr:Sigma-70, region 4 [Sphingobacterium sp.]